MAEFGYDGLRNAPKSFYLPLISDSSTLIFPENALSHFRVQLQEPLNLEGRWEVGLAEVLVHPPSSYKRPVVKKVSAHVYPPGSLWPARSIHSSILRPVLASGV